ncbi:hypothetical protein V2I01_39360 [Micromonospora sp. BRA006-A]|nr:hypothetical protein [Micromonospora sp. BRA006-A]
MAVTATAAAAGVTVSPAALVRRRTPGPHLRLTYAAPPPEQMDEAIRRLSTALPH